MVTLYSMVQQQSLPNAWSGITTGVPSLDEKLLGGGLKGVYDFQVVPSSSSMEMVICEMLASYLKKGPDKRVVMINTFNDFPLQFMKLRKDFNSQWFSHQIQVYNLDTVSKLVIHLQKLNQSLSSDTIVVINNFHELLELYKLELSSCHQEMILRVHAANNKTIIDHTQQHEIEGTLPRMIEIPRISNLVRESPNSKYGSHVTYVYNLLSQLAYHKNSLVFITGSLDVKFKTWSLPSSSFMDTSASFDSSQATPPASALPSTGSRSSPAPTQYHPKGRLVLTFSDHQMSPGNRSSSGIFEAVITKRVMFFKDWYHKTPEATRKRSRKEKLVFGARVDGDETIYFEIVDNDLVDLSEVSKPLPAPSLVQVSTVSSSKPAANTGFLDNLSSSPGVFPSSMPLATSTSQGGPLTLGTSQPGLLATSTSQVVLVATSNEAVFPGQEVLAEEVEVQSVDEREEVELSEIETVEANNNENDNDNDNDNDNGNTDVDQEKGHRVLADSNHLDLSSIIQDSQDMGTPLFL